MYPACDGAPGRMRCSRTFPLKTARREDRPGGHERSAGSRDGYTWRRGLPAEIHGNDRRSRLGEHGSVDAAAGSCVEHELVRPEEVVQIFARLDPKRSRYHCCRLVRVRSSWPYDPPIFLHLKAKVASAPSSSAKSGTPATIGKRSPESSTRFPSRPHHCALPGSSRSSEPSTGEQRSSRSESFTSHPPGTSPFQREIADSP